MSHEKVEEKLSNFFCVLGGNPVHCVVHEYINLCYIRKCLGGGEVNMLCCFE